MNAERSIEATADESRGEAARGRLEGLIVDGGLTVASRATR